jgi:hypothetical protein
MNDTSHIIRIGAQMLQVASEYDVQRGLRITHKKAIAGARKKLSPDLTSLIDCLSTLVVAEDNEATIFKMANVEDLSEGMILDQEVTDINGLLLMASGQIVTETVIQRLNAFARRKTLSQPFRVRLTG